MQALLNELHTHAEKKGKMGTNKEFREEKTIEDRKRGL
jgi:hypothetical protein